MDREELKNKYIDLAMNKLDYRMRTEKEIRDYLKGLDSTKMEIDDDIIDEAIDFLKFSHFLDDVVYSEEYFKYGKKKLWGEQRILLELLKKGVSREDARQGFENAIENSDEKIDSDKESALKLGIRIARENSETDPDKLYARIGRRLASLGYSPALCYDVIGKIRNMLEKQSNDD